MSGGALRSCLAGCVVTAGFLDATAPREDVRGNSAKLGK
jgi:hypothetical protein